MANMSCACVRGLVVRHSSFVVADCCCCHCFHATQYDMMIWCARVRYVVVAVVPRDVSSCACARGLIVVARLATRPACCALAHKALSSSPVWQCDRHVVRLRTRPYCRRLSGNVTGMLCACARGLIIVARLATQPACRALAHKALSSSPVWRRNLHVVRLRTRPYRRRPSGDAAGMSCACARGLIIVAHLAMRPACRALAHKALSSSPVW